MNKKELQDLLNKELLGKDFDPSMNAWHIVKILKEKYPNKASGMFEGYLEREGICCIKYRGHRLIGWKMTKKKSEYTGCLRGCRWIISSVALFDWFNEELGERFNEIETTIKKNEQAQEIEHLKRVENFKKIRALFPNCTCWELRSILEGVKAVAFSEIEKEK